MEQYFQNPQSQFKFKLSGSGGLIKIAGPKDDDQSLQEGSVAGSGTDVFSTGITRSITYFKRIMERYPGLVSKMAIRTNDTSQFDKLLTTATDAFSAIPEKNFIDPQNFESSYQSNAQLITLNFPFLLGPDDWLEFDMVPSTNVITLYFNQIQNDSAAFVDKIRQMTKARQP